MKPKWCRHDDVEGSRTDELFGLFDNWHRAIVVETNDPLNMGRVRFKCPEMPDENLAPAECPWAVPAPSLGGPKSGAWRSLTIGDQVFIAFEKAHPYAPIWVAAADPTRYEQYPLPSIHTRTPLPVDRKGQPGKHPADFDPAYLPKDNRPMSQGIIDRYGNIDMMSAVGFFPVEHKRPAPEGDYDPIQRANFSQSREIPKVNDPDSKFMVRMSKYGHIMFSGDQGYWWQREDPRELDQEEEDALTDEEKREREIQQAIGEFYGDAQRDKEWEVKRWYYLRALLHEGEVGAVDQRRSQLLTRYGHKFEMRDVGWAQVGPIESKTRSGEYDQPRLLSREEERDYRWIKLRTKGGMLFQMYDKGMHPQEDNFIKRKLIDEVGTKTEEEDQYWKDRDARFIRLISRYGFKFVIDDRGSHDKRAEEDEFESPRANGIMFKGRRTGGARGKPINLTNEDEPLHVQFQRGFYWEFNENDTTNMTTWGSPLGTTVQLSDKLQYLMAVAGRRGYPREWKRHKENEFLLEPLANYNTEMKTHHLKLDHDNEYIRLKTRSGKGSDPIAEFGYIRQDGEVGEFVNKAERGEQQGIEFRDGMKGDGPWAELVDMDRRGVWFSRKFKMSVFRALTTPTGRSNQVIWHDEGKCETIIRNNELGYYIPPPDDAPPGTPPTFVPARLQIFCRRNVEIISENGRVNIKARGDICLASDTRISMRGGGVKMELSGANPKFTGVIIAPNLRKSMPNVRILGPPDQATPPQIQPTDRGKRYNSGLEASADPNEIEHKIEEPEEDE